MTACAVRLAAFHPSDHSDREHRSLCVAYSQQPTPEITSAGGDADAGRGRGDAPGSKLRGPDDQGELPGPGARHPHSRAAAVLYRRARRASSGCRRDVDAITGSERVRAGGRGVFAPDTASQGMVTGKEIDEQPRSRFAEVLEVVSGLIGHPVPIRAPVTTNPSARRGRWHPRLLASGSQLTLRWRGLDSNFQYAGAVNLVVPLYAAEWSGRVGAPSQFSDSTTPCIRAA